MRPDAIDIDVAESERLRERGETTPTVVLIPTFGAAGKLRRCLESLHVYAKDVDSIVVLDDGTPDGSIRELCGEFESLPGFEYARADVNVGFVSTCNWGFERFRPRGADLLLLNSDTELTDGALAEMQAVLHLHEKHGMVTPRSNNATIYSLPMHGPRLEADEAFALWLRIRDLLPRYHVMPTAVGFCMLVSGVVLDRFGLFDEVYSPGYNEENDFVCRVNRYGYSAIAANRAFVFHHEMSSFGVRRIELETKNSHTLTSRYPEYLPNIRAFEHSLADPVEHFSSLFVPHRPRLLFDVFNLPAAYNGTAEFSLNLLRELSFLLDSDFDIYVGIGRDALDFFQTELAGYRFYVEPCDERLYFDLLFKPAQVFEWADLLRMNRLAPRFCFNMQDVIAVRCQYLNSVAQQAVVKKSAELADFVFTISEFSRRDFEMLYGTTLDNVAVIHHGTNYERPQHGYSDGKYVLIVGNHYAHKGVEDAIAALYGSRPVVVLGGKEKSETPAFVRRLKSGHLDRGMVRQLFLDSSVVVYPSLYEGFGLPVLDALALGKPVIAMDSAISRELKRSLVAGELRLVQSFGDLAPAIEEVLTQPRKTHNFRFPDWKNVGRRYARYLSELATRELDYPKLRERWDWLKSIESTAAARD